MLFGFFGKRSQLHNQVVQKWFNSCVGVESKIKPSGRVLFLLNVRINSQTRVNRLINLLQLLGPTIPISLRMRGNFSNNSSLQTFLTWPNVKFIDHSSFREWKLDLLEQVTKSNFDYFVLLQEDHLPVVSLEVLSSVVDDCARHFVDFMPLSFFPHYQKLVHSLNQSRVQSVKNKNILFWDFDRDVIEHENFDLDVYPVNLIGFFSKDLLIKILCTERPFFKRYSIESPFDFEQPNDQTWYLPIKWASPAFELLACIDDDHGIPGYSLSARGVYSGEQNRQVDHHSAGFVLGDLSPTLFSVKLLLIRILPNQLLVLPRNLKYTLESLRGFRKRRNIQRMLLSNS